MALRLGDRAPDFSAETTRGTINFHDWIEDGWCILFSHPKDFTPVCTTELGRAAALKPEFEARNARIIWLSVDSVGDHELWSKDIEETQGCAVNFPLIADSERAVATLYGMLEADDEATATVRSVFVIGPDKLIKLILTYPASTGRNFDEVLRVLDSLQLTHTDQLATPVDWKPGEDAIVVPALSDEEAVERFGEFRAPKPYLRYVKIPD